MAINLDHVTEQITVTDEAANADLNVIPKGTGSVTIGSKSLAYFNFANGSNYVQLSAFNPGATADFVINSQPTSGVAQISLRTQNANQAIISHTSSAVNYVNLTGGATTVAPTISAQGSDANIVLRLGGKGSGTVDFSSNGNPYALQVVGVASGANYNSWRATSGAGGSGASSAPVMSTWGIDTNISAVLQSKGTGAIDLAAGSAGVNISNGTTVTAITRTVLGSYTSNPTLAISAPTTAGGVQATANAIVQNTGATIAGGGTGYTVGDTISMVGGTLQAGLVGTFTVATVSGGVITAVNNPSFSQYSTAPTNPVSVTGGTGSGATLNVTYIYGYAVITNAGSGYVEQPTVTFSGGGGSGAAAYATVGSPPIIRSLAGAGSGTQSLSFYGSSGEALRLNTSTTSLPAINYGYVSPGAQNNGIQIGSQGADTNIWLGLTTKGSGNVQFLTGGGNNEQLRVAHTASSVNYLNVTGSSAGNAVIFSSQGSDSNVWINYQTKGTGTHQFLTNNGGQAQLLVSHTGSAVNYVNITGAGTGGAPSVIALGSDTNIPLSVAPKGTGILYLGGGQTRLSANNANVFHGNATAGSVNFFSIIGTQTGISPAIIARGGDANVGLTFGTFNDANIDFYASGDPNAGTGRLQLRVAPTASAVNYVQVTGATTGNPTVFSTQGSDASVPILFNAKGANGYYNFTTANTGNSQLVIMPTSSAVNQLRITGSITGFGPRLYADGSDTNIPLVLQPKGTGALQAQQTDSTATGGNARGSRAVDLQMGRDSASQVADGAGSVIGGGYANRSGGNFNVVAGGNNNTATYSFGVIGEGVGNSLTANSAVIAGGASNVITFSPGNNWSFIGAGQVNTAHGVYNLTVGGYGNSGTSGTSVTTQSATMNGTTAVTLSGSNASIKVGQYIIGTSIAADTYVAAISGTSLTLSKVASGSSTSTLSFYTPHGVVVGGGNNQATGSYSFIGGGGDAGTAANRNVASGDWSAVVGGRSNTASGNGSFVGGGGYYAGIIFANTASGAHSTIAGGLSNATSGLGAFIGGGYANNANGNYSSIVGGVRSITRGIEGYVTFGPHVNPISDSNGVSQTSILIVARQTTDATATVLTSNAIAAGTTNQVILPNNAAYFFTGEVVAGVTGGGNTKGWTIEGVIKRGANAASTALVGTPTVTSMYADVGAATWAIAVTADTTNGGLAVTFTGQLATTIRVVAQIRTTEMTF